MAEFDQLNNLTNQTIDDPTSEKPPQINNDANKLTPPDYSKAENYDNNPDTRRAQLMERLRLKNKILQYQEKFSDELKVYDYRMNQLDELSNPDLEIFLDEIKIAVRQRNSANMTKSFYFGAANFLEKGACKLGYDIKGFHNVLYNQKEIHKCLDEIALEYEDSLYMPAHVRLPYITLQVAMSLYEIKKTDNIINNELKKNVTKDVTEEYKDL